MVMLLHRKASQASSMSKSKLRAWDLIWATERLNVTWLNSCKTGGPSGGKASQLSHVARLLYDV